MKRVLKAEGIKATKGYLTVYVRAEVGTTVRFVSVKVPWFMLNADYENVAGYMAHDAQERLALEKGQPWLPLESWE